MAQRKGTVRERRFTREDSYEDLDKRVSFRVTTDSGWYHFLALVTHPETGEQWVDGYGGEGRGKDHQASHRSFHLHLLKRDRSGRVVTRPYNTKENDE